MSDFKENFGKAAKSVAKGTGAIVKTAGLSIKLSNEEANLKSIYADIGRAVHEVYKRGGSLGLVFDEKHELILKSEAKIAELKTKLEIAKGTITCGKCAATSKRESAFCPKCGGALTEEAADAAIEAKPTREIPPEQVPPPAPAAPTGKICNVCGTNNDAGDRFCLSCGRIM